jgi:hypothetical protein
MDDALPIYPLSRRARTVVAAVVVVLVIGATGVWWRFHYGIWPGAQYPSSLHYCHDSYNRDRDAGTRSGAEVLADDYRPAEFAGSPLLQVFEFRAPLARTRPVFRNTPERVHVGDTRTCTIALYLQTGTDRYLTYKLHDPFGSPEPFRS